MDSTGLSAAPTTLYTNAAARAARPPSSMPSHPPSGGNNGNGGHRNKNNNKNRNGGHGGGNNSRTAASTGLHGHVGPLSVTRVPTQPAAVAAALPAGRSRSLTRLEPLGRRGLGPVIVGPLLQHHGAPPTSNFGPGLAGRLRRDAPHHSVSW
jgi:hypothetical protein